MKFPFFSGNKRLLKAVILYSSHSTWTHLIIVTVDEAIIPILYMGNKDIERLSTLPRVTQAACGKNEAEI